MKSGNFNFLEPSGPLQDCNGNAAAIYSHSPLLRTIKGVLRECAGQLNSRKGHYMLLRWSHNDCHKPQVISHDSWMANFQYQEQVRKGLTVTEMLCKAGLKKKCPKRSMSNIGLCFAQTSIYSMFQKSLHQRHKHV